MNFLNDTCMTRYYTQHIHIVHNSSVCVVVSLLKTLMQKKRIEVEEIERMKGSEYVAVVHIVIIIIVVNDEVEQYEIEDVLEEIWL